MDVRNLSISGDGLRAFEAAARGSAALDAAVTTLGDGCVGAMLVRHALATAPVGAATASSLVAEIGANANAGTDDTSLTIRLDVAGFAAVVSPETRRVLDEIWNRDERHSVPLLDAAVAAGSIVAAAPSAPDAQRAAALAGALCLARRGVVSAPFLTVPQLDASARSAAVQVDRSNAWEEWVRAWCTLLVREIGAAQRAVADASARFAAERSEVANRPRIGNTDRAVVEWLQSHLTFTIRDASAALRLTTPTVGTSIARLEEAGIATELTGQRRDRVWVSTGLLHLAQSR